MKKEQIFALVAALYLLDIKERAELIKATVKETGVGAGELFKELKEAGYNPKAEKGTAAPVPKDAPPPDPPPITHKQTARTPCRPAMASRPRRTAKRKPPLRGGTKRSIRFTGGRGLS
jgi:hypothetical protein